VFSPALTVFTVSTYEYNTNTTCTGTPARVVQSLNTTVPCVRADDYVFLFGPNGNYLVPSLASAPLAVQPSMVGRYVYTSKVRQSRCLVHVYPTHPLTHLLLSLSLLLSILVSAGSSS